MNIEERVAELEQKHNKLEKIVEAIQKRLIPFLAKLDNKNYRLRKKLRST